MVNAEEIFEISMALADTLSGTGAADCPENREYRARALPILRSLISELMPYAGTGDDLPEDFSSAVELEPGPAREILPYGLAAALIMPEDPENGVRFQRRYELLKAGICRGRAQGSGDTEDVYGGFAHNGFGRW